MRSNNESIRDLVKQIMSGRIQLPEIQRRYVWKPEKVRALIDSIYKGYPSGSILLWETNQDIDLRPDAAAPPATGPSPVLLLDGQQRLKSLAAVLEGYRPNRDDPAPQIYFNLDHPEKPSDPDTDYDDLRGAGTDDTVADHRVFQLKNPTVERSPHWISVTKLFREDPFTVLSDHGIGPDHPNYKKFFKRAYYLHKRADEYMYPVQTLGPDTTYEEVTDIFVRLNSQGTKLRKADLALAQVTSKWRGAMKLFTRASKSCKARGFDLDERLLIKCLVAVATDQNQFKNVGKLDIDKLKGDWNLTKKGLDFAIKFLKDRAMIETTDVLPSLFLVIPIARLAVKHDYSFAHDIGDKALRWLYAALIWGRYSRGATETMLDKDLATIRDIQGDPLSEMIEAVRSQAGRIEVTAADLEGKTKQSSLFRMMYAAAKRYGAVDWGTGLPLAIDGERGFKALHARVFPIEDVMAALEQKYGKKKARQLANDIANTVFHSRRTGKAAPSEYLPGIVEKMGEAALTAQGIPADPSLWTVDRYEDFVAARREMLALRINELIRWPLPEPPPPQDCREAIRAGEGSTIEFKASMLHDLETGQRNPDLGKSILKTIAAFMNTGGGVIYVGVTDDGEVRGIEPDYKLAGKHGSWDGWSQVLSNMINKIVMPVPFSYVSYDRVELEDASGSTRDIAKITVLPAQSPAWIKVGNSPELFVRQGPTSKPLDTMNAAAHIRKRFPRWDG